VKFKIGFLCLIAMFMLQAHAASAEPFMCVVSDGASADESFESLVQEAKYSCEQLKRIATGLEVSAITVQIGNIYLACTGVGTPVALAIQGGVLGLQTMKVIVGNLPCEDKKQEKGEADLKQFVCEQMAMQGFVCNL